MKPSHPLLELPPESESQPEAAASNGKHRWRPRSPLPAGQSDSLSSRDAFEAAISLLPYAVVIVDEEGKIRQHNRRFTTLWTLPRKILAESESSAVWEWIEQCLANPTGHEAEAFHAEMFAHPVSTRILRLKDGRTLDRRTCRFQNSRTERLCIVQFQDVTVQLHAARERSRLEAQLLRVQQCRSLEAVTSGMAHDFKNILCAIYCNAELARMNLTSFHPSIKPLEEIIRSSARAESLVRRILSLGRTEGMERSFIRLRPVIEEALGLLKATIPAHIAVSLAPEGGDPFVLADSNHLHQVMLNLITNAVHAIGSNPGRIDLRVRTESADAIDPSVNGSRVRGPCHVLEVADTGVGLTASVKAKLFRPFFTTKARGEGSGIGLSVVRRIMDAHDGQIGVESEPGQGASFRLFFPAHDYEPMTIAPGLLPPPVPEGRPLLFVDDEKPLAELAARLMASMGFAVTALTSTTEALRLLEAPEAGFVALVCDANLRILAGETLAERAMDVCPSLPVVVLGNLSATIAFGPVPMYPKLLTRKNLQDALAFLP